jgi:arsenate reductase
MLTVYEYSKCSTCRNALRWLDARGVRYEKVDIVAHPPSAELLEDLLTRSGLPVARLFNTSGQSYRQGKYKELLKQMSRSETLAALAGDGKLIKRPLVISSELVLVGFDEAAYERAIDALAVQRGERSSR